MATTTVDDEDFDAWGDDLASDNLARGRSRRAPRTEVKAPVRSRFASVIDTILHRAFGLRLLTDEQVRYMEQSAKAFVLDQLVRQGRARESECRRVTASADAQDELPQGMDALPEISNQGRAMSFPRAKQYRDGAATLARLSEAVRASRPQVQDAMEQGALDRLLASLVRVQQERELSEKAARMISRSLRRHFRELD